MHKENVSGQSHKNYSSKKFQRLNTSQSEPVQIGWAKVYSCLWSKVRNCIYYYYYYQRWYNLSYRLIKVKHCIACYGGVNVCNWLTVSTNCYSSVSHRTLRSFQTLNNLSLARASTRKSLWKSHFNLVLQDSRYLLNLYCHLTWFMYCLTRLDLF